MVRGHIFLGIGAVFWEGVFLESTEYSRQRRVSEFGDHWVWVVVGGGLHLYSPAEGPFAEVYDDELNIALSVSSAG